MFGPLPSKPPSSPPGTQDALLSCSPWLSPVFMAWRPHPFGDAQCSRSGLCDASSSCVCADGFSGSACQYSAALLATYQEELALWLGIAFFMLLLVAALAVYAHVRLRQLDPEYQRELLVLEKKEYHDLLDRDAARDDDEALISFPFDDAARHEDPDEPLLSAAGLASASLGAALSPEDADLFAEPERPGTVDLDVDFSDLPNPRLETLRVALRTPTQIADRHIRLQHLNHYKVASNAGILM